MAGRTEAAAVEWRAALRLVEERLVERPNDPMLLCNRVVLLASLAEREKAAREFEILAQMTVANPVEERTLQCWKTRACILLGRHAEAIQQIRTAVNQRKRVLADYSAATLRLEPIFDPLRHEPEFRRLLADAERIERQAAGNTALNPSPRTSP
jgi:hypothetical protein